MDATNPWSGVEPPPLEAWDPAGADMLFLAGLDWTAVPERTQVPTINLIQGTRYAARGDPRRGFLSRRAVRICVSGEVADAVRATGLVNGPLFTIENALDLDSFPPSLAQRDIPVLLSGVKRPLRGDN